MPRFLNGPSSIGWCDYTWNPVTGCKRDCRFGPDGRAGCYAKAQAERFGLSFEPQFHSDRLKARFGLLPRHDHRPRVFVCSMGDLFGPWVSSAWIERVLEVVRSERCTTFQFLTKYPERYREFGAWPANCWLGATVTGAENEHVWQRINALLDAEAPVYWLSVEPLSGPLPCVSTRMWQPGASGWEQPLRRRAGNIRWVVVGGCTGPGAFQPEEEWVDDLEAQCDRYGVPIFHKSNLACRQGAARRTEFPEG